MNRKLVAIVPAAGVGARAGTAIPKQYQPIHGLPMLRLAVVALLADPRIDEVRVAVAAGDTRAPEALRGLPRMRWPDACRNRNQRRGRCRAGRRRLGIGT